MSDTKRDEKIKKATLKDSGLYLEYDEIIENEEDGPVINVHKVMGGHKPHQDLTNAFKALHVHLALICEQMSENNGIVSIKKKSSSEILSSMRTLEMVNQHSVTGFSIGGEDEHEGVTLIGQRKLTSGDVLNLISPFKKWSSDYKHASDLEVEMQVVLQECLEYLHGKHAPNPQLELELDTDQKEHAA